ncbi:hypothetical protein E5288_WYG013124 [Bos mutus]|uniref:Uncharacterized protein n=1 Tax=Bos mutus TaxID=72004 RepID=A0A6B0RF31_9CETA|nr:hypothetical protein [Bos mutus]
MAYPLRSRARLLLSLPSLQGRHQCSQIQFRLIGKEDISSDPPALGHQLTLVRVKSGRGYRTTSGSCSRAMLLNRR